MTSATSSLPFSLPGLLIGLLVALPLGYFHAAWAGWALLCLILGVQQLMHWRNFARLERWSHAPLADTELQGDGAWDSVFGRLYQHEKQQSEQIARRDAQIRVLMAAGQALTDGVVLLDDGGRILFCNTTAEQQLGLVTASDRGQAIVNLVRQPEFIAYLQAGAYQQPLSLRSERLPDCLLSIHIIPYGAGHQLLQAKDVTHSERLERTRRDFVANVSHELRTPLTVLSGFIETLQEIELPAADQQRYLSLMADQSRRMQSIVQDLLTLSSIESAPPPSSEPIDMANLLTRLERDAQALSGGRHQLIIEHHGPAELHGAEAELLSAFGNLVANAVRYTPAGGCIRLSWQTLPEGAGAEFAVQDNGIGIAAEHLPRLSERFYRVDRSRSRDSGGTGLGLAIVKHSLNRHQAQLLISSTPGQGSRFAARFPAARIGSSQSDMEPGAPAP